LIVSCNIGTEMNMVIMYITNSNELIISCHQSIILQD